MHRGTKVVAERTSRRVSVCLVLLLPAAFLAGCRKQQAQEAGAESVRVTRYRCNIAPAHDVVDVYAEVVNRGRRRTGPVDLVVRVIRPDEDVVEGRTSMGRLGPHEERQVSLRFTCRGYAALRHVSLAVEPTPAPEETQQRPGGAR